MDEQADLASLPAPYGVALRLAAEGADDETISRATGVDAASVPALVAIGRRKLADLRRDAADPTDGPSPP